MYFQMAHQLTFVGWIVIDLPDLSHLAFVFPIFVGAQNCSQRLYVGVLFGYFVDVFILNKLIFTILTFSSCEVVARAKADVLVSI